MRDEDGLTRSEEKNKEEVISFPESEMCLIYKTILFFFWGGWYVYERDKFIIVMIDFQWTFVTEKN